MKRLGSRSPTNPCARPNSLARANALANALVLARDLAHDLDNAGVLVGTLARTNALACALANAGTHNLDHALNLDHARHLAGDLARALANDVDRDVARNLARDLARNLVDLDPTAHWVRAVVAGGAQSMPGRTSRGLVALAVRMLPMAQRSRYREEFRVELVELPCRGRLGYSLRLLASAWELRRALVEAVCPPDGAAASRAQR